MRIVVNDIAASTGGAMTVLRDFYTAVCNGDKEHEWIFLLGDRYFAETDNVKIRTLPEIKKSGLKKLIFDFFTGKQYIQTLKPDVVLSLQNIITFGVKVPQAVYIHQSIPFQTVKKFSFFRGNERKLAFIQYLIGEIIKLSAKKSDYVIVQTKWMKDAVCRMCRVPEEKVMTSLPAVKPLEVGEAVPFDTTAFFYPTAPAIYKNNACVFKASELLNTKGVDHTVTLTLPPEKSSGSVTCTGRLPYEEVMNRYRGATLVFPSYIETFGYPLAEARMASAIVLAADTPFAREVLEGYENAYFFDPFKPEELAALMERVTSGEIVKTEVAQDAVRREEHWRVVLNQVLELGGRCIK